jgi:predicted O-methyltransferase YrrM
VYVVDAAYDNDAQTAAIKEFNNHVAADERVEQLILPERDGLSVIRVR